MDLLDGQSVVYFGHGVLENNMVGWSCFSDGV